MTVTGFEESAGSQPLEFGLQIAVEVCAATEPAASDPDGSERGPSLVPRFLESVHALLRELSLGPPFTAGTWPA
jgi:hypothetical protein